MVPDLCVLHLCCFLYINSHMSLGANAFVPVLVCWYCVCQYYLWHTVCVGKYRLNCVVHADLIQNAHAELCLALISCNIKRREVHG